MILEHSEACGIVYGLSCPSCQKAWADSLPQAPTNPDREAWARLAERHPVLIHSACEPTPVPAADEEEVRAAVATVIKHRALFADLVLLLVGHRIVKAIETYSRAK